MTRKQISWGLAVVALLAVTVAGIAAAQAEDENQQREARVFFLGGSARLGVHVSDITAEKAKELELPGEYGALVESVEEDSPAARAGLAENDVILEFAGERVRSVAHLRRLVRETPPGRTVALEVSRDGRTQSLQATLEERSRLHLQMPDFDVQRIVPRIRIPGIRVEALRRRPRLGISGGELTDQLAEYFGVQQGKGVLVREVLAGSAAAKAGLKAGDVIIRLGEEEISSVRELRHALARAHGDSKVTLTIVRDRREQTVEVELEKPTPHAPRETAGLEIELGAEVWAHAAEEMSEAAEEWEEQLERWQEKFEQQLGDWEATWQGQLREAERQLRQQIESKQFREEIKKLEETLKRVERELVTF
ncbi:MAG: PDZ domain-containing protein [Terriglobia bacterium]